MVPVFLIISNIEKKTGSKPCLTHRERRAWCGISLTGRILSVLISGGWRAGHEKWFA